MKFSLRLGTGDNLDPQTASTCCTTNLICPGCGSLMAGRRVGYFQLAFTLIGFVLTTLFGCLLMTWAVRNWSDLMSAAADPLDLLIGMWRFARWAMLGMLLFGLAWLWALMTSLNVLQVSKRTPHRSENIPPIIGRTR